MTKKEALTELLKAAKAIDALRDEVVIRPTSRQSRELFADLHAAIAKAESA